MLPNADDHPEDATRAPLAIRDAAEADFAQILALNEASVAVLSPLTPERLAWLHAQAAWHRVLLDGDRVAAFLLVLAPGGRYDSPNYRWFEARYSDFLYIDRVVVAPGHRGRGCGPQLYDDLFARARRIGAPRVTCEFDIDPPNEASRRFHQRYGFEEVGTQRVAGGRKAVSLQMARVSVAAGPR